MRVAVVGGGVAGLGAADVLARAHEVEVFEREERPGGHVKTVYVDGLALCSGVASASSGFGRRNPT